MPNRLPGRGRSRASTCPTRSGSERGKSQKAHRPWNQFLCASVANAAPILFGDNGHYYEYVSTGRNWFNARDEAETRTFLGMSGYLATITSEAENDFLRDTFGEVAWLGATDIDTEGTWVWETGPEAGTVFWTGGAGGSPVGGAFVNWEIGEPNNQHGDEDALHTWGRLSGDGSSVGRWNDTTPYDTPGYYVEYSSDASIVPLPTAVWSALPLLVAIGLVRYIKGRRAAVGV